MKATSPAAAYLMQALGVAMFTSIILAFFAIIGYVAMGFNPVYVATSILTAVVINVLGVKTQLIMEKKYNEETKLEKTDYPET